MPNTNRLVKKAAMTYFLSRARQATKLPPASKTKGKIILLKASKITPPTLISPTFLTMA